MPQKIDDANQDKKPNTPPFVVEIEEADVPELKKMKEVVRPIVSKPTVGTEQKPKPQWGMFFAGMATMLVIVILSGGLWWGYRMQWGELAESTPVPEVIEVTATPLPTPEPVSLTPVDFEVVVLNGSGQTGLAGTTSSQLEALGYQVERTGNAVVQTGTTISFGQRAATLSAEIIKDMEPVLGQVEVAAEMLTDELAIEIILGQED